MKNYALLISSFAWPVVVLVIAMMFRNEIIALVKRLEKLVGFGIEAGFMEAIAKLKKKTGGVERLSALI
jgi:hypothetical protein